MRTIQRYEIPNRDGAFDVALPAHCTVLGIHGAYLVVLGVHDPERAVPKQFVAVFADDPADHIARHRYLGSLVREYQDGFSRRIQHVFEWLPLPVSDHMGPGHG